MKLLMKLLINLFGSMACVIIFIFGFFYSPTFTTFMLVIAVLGGILGAILTIKKKNKNKK